MTKRVISILICLCICMSLIPSVAFAAVEEPQEIVVSHVSDAKSIPQNYQGIVVERVDMGKVDGGQLYAIKMGLYNSPAGRCFAINFEYDSDKVKTCKATGVTSTVKNQYIADGEFTASMLTDAAGASDYLGEKITDSLMFVRDALTPVGATNRLQLSYTLGSAEDMAALNGLVEGLNVAGCMYTPPKNEVIYLGTIYFLAEEGKEIDENTFKIYKGITSDAAGIPGACIRDENDEGASWGAVLVNFPQPAVASYTVPFTVYKPGGVDPLANVNANIYAEGNLDVPVATGTSAAGTGTFTVELPAGNYTYSAEYTGDDPSLKLQTTTGNFTVVAPGSGNEAAAQTITMSAVPADKQSVKFKVVDGDDNSKPIAGAMVTLGESKETDSNGVTTAYTVDADSYVFQVTATGYEDLIASTDAASKILTVGTDTVSFATDYVEKYGSRLEWDADTDTATIILSAKRTAITIPIPVPTNGDTAIDVSQAGNLKVVISANPDGSTPATLALPITVTTTADSSGNKLNFAPTEGNMTSLNALVNLPKGNYIITVSGAGIDSVDTSLNVVPGTDGTAVNVGGTVTEGTVNGGYTDKTTGETIDLGTNTSATTGSTIDNSGNVTSGTNATGGLLDNLTDAGFEGGITVIADPLYYVVGNWDSSETTMTVEVYLKNIKATMGTFGLKYDTNVFSGLSEADGFTFASGLSATDYGQSMGLNNPTKGEGYHSFYWTVSGGSNVNPVDATSQPQLIATYKLAKKNGVDLSKLMHNEALTVIPFGNTEAGETAKTFYGDKTQDYEYFASEYWRETSFTADNANRNILSDEKATAGGFYQAYNTAEGSDPVKANDVRSQFVFEDYGNVAVHIVVNSTSGSPVSGAEVTLSSGGTTLTGKTDKNGEAVISCPPNTTQDIKISANGYLAYPQDGDTDKTVTVGTTPVTKTLSLTPQQGHPVTAAPVGQVTLSGEPKAYNTVDYYFTLSPAPGYEWKNGLPAPALLTIKLADVSQEDDIDGDQTLTATWDSAKNRYKIAGDTIKGSPVDADSDAGEITITVSDEALQPAGAGEAKYIVTATAGVGGTVSYTARDGGTASQFTGTSGQTGTITETLGLGESTSATYTFKPNESGAPQGSIYVIHKIIINGAEMNPTDAQRREGYIHQFTGITGDQNITVTFGTMPEEGGEITPVDEATPVTVIVGDYGQAEVRNGNNAEVTLNGGTTGAYVVASGDSLTVKPTAATSVPQPDGDTQNYEIDKVMVNGVQVNGEVAGTGWDASASTLTLSKLTAPATVVITFKPEGGESIQAIVESSVVSGRGAIITTGTNVYTVGDRPVFSLAPEAENWTVDSLKLTTPGAEAPADVTGQISEQKYTAPALAAGVTKLEAAFVEQTYQVRLLVDLSNGGVIMGLQKSPVTVKFQRTAGGEPVTLNFEKLVPSGNNVTLEAGIPEGTWTVTVGKKGYLNYEIKDFTIAAGGTTTDTATKDSVIFFGVKVENSNPDEPKAIKLTIGDASWDGYRISPNGAAQVVNGMIANASQAMKDRADIDESGNGGSHSLATDMGYVKLNYGKLYTSRTYSDFLALTYSA